MSVVSLLGVKVVNNPAKFTDKYEFEITFECLEPLEKGALVALKPSDVLGCGSLTDNAQISNGS